MKSVVTGGSGFIGSYLVNTLIDAGREIIVLDHYKNFIYIENLVKGHIFAFKKEAENQIFNLEGKERVSIKKIAETIKKLVGRKVKIEYLPGRPGDYAGKEASNDKVWKVLEWEPKVNFEEGMRRTIEWYKSVNGIK